MNRREFAGTVLTYGLLQMLWARDLFAADVKPVVGRWFADLNALGNDLKGRKLKDIEFQAKMEELYKKVDLPELVQFIDLDRIAENVKLPANGAWRVRRSPGSGPRAAHRRRSGHSPQRGTRGRHTTARRHRRASPSRDRGAAILSGRIPHGHHV